MSTTTLSNGEILGNTSIAAGDTYLLQDSDSAYLEGTLTLAGTLSLGATGDDTNLVLDSVTVSLIGGGILLLSDSGNNRILGNDSTDSTLINVNNTIEGAGQIGINSSGQPLTLTNASAGVIDANAANNALVIATGGPTLVNDGLMEATGTGGLLITDSSAVDQTGGGTILASGAGDNVVLNGDADIIGGMLLDNGGGLIDVSNGTLDGSEGAAITIGTSSTVQLAR
jgi:hypothetical protein